MNFTETQTVVSHVPACSQLCVVYSASIITGTGLFGLAVSDTGHFGHNISVHKQLITFVYLNDYRQAKCHSSWCYTNSL